MARFADEAEIRKLHFKYGYYLDKCLYQEVHFQRPKKDPSSILIKILL